MLNLCYSAPEGAAPVPSSASAFPDRKVRVSTRRVQGDLMAQKVLETLAEIACLYGDQVILLQYLPYAWDLLSQCKKKVSANVEGGLLGVVSMVHHIVPYLTDSVLMNELPDNILVNVLFPALQVVASRSFCFHGGWRSRQALAFRILDLTYLIGLRIGEEMSRSHLTPLCSAFFSGFNKVYGEEGHLLKIADESAESRAVSLELSRSLTPELAYSAYVAFYNLFGRAHLDGNIMNLESVRALCLQFQQERGEDKLPPRPVTFSCLRAVAADSPAAGATDGSSGNNSSSKLNVGSSAGGGGNLLAGTEAAAAINDELHNLIARDTTCSSSSSGGFSRHLKGNWLAYWEHEIGRTDSETFNLKQIRLQGFAGHSAGIKCLHALDGENSFMTGSRDKTVKVWSLRSQGDGTAKVASQWTYSLHKRSVFFVTFLERARLAVSCDSAVHVWDPFVGSVVHQVDAAQRLGPVHVVAPLAEPSSVVVVATQDSLLHLVDCRVGSVTADLKVSVGSAGLVRALSTSCDGNTMLVGHTSGSLSTLDLRTGKLRHSWKGHEGEILALTAMPGGEFLSSSLDQTISLWRGDEGKLRCSLPGVQEPANFVEYLEATNEIVIASTSNRITVRHGTAQDSKFHAHKLKSEVLRGNVTAMKALHLNRLLLLGQDNGSVALLC